MESQSERGRDVPHATKTRILETAEDVFAQSGFAGASTREIAAKAGVNISSLHYHWESKETLYFGVFQSIYDRILNVVRGVIPERVDPTNSRAIIESSMGALFDFFADNPNIPKLMVRRLLENDEGPAAIEADVLVPAWQSFAQWMRAGGGPELSEFEAQMFMLTVHNVLLLFLLDSRHYAKLLGGSVNDPEIRARVRQYVIQLVPLLLGSHRPPAP